jgi:hypothetical protein
MAKRSVFLVVMTLVLTGVSVPPAQASFHLMQIEQVIGGVDGDATAQAIQLRMRAGGQNLLASARIRAWDATGSNPVVVINFASGVANASAGDRVLITSAPFNTSTNPAASPDFAMTNLIPGSYLAAGSLTFENNTGTQVWWRLSWGGGSYTGATTGIAGGLGNDADGEFGPPFTGPLPSSSTQSLLFLGSATAASTNNSADYNVTSNAAVFANNGGSSFTVQSQATGVPRSVPPRTELLQNQPNPFNPRTEIVFTMARAGHASLRVYDVTGRPVTTLVDGTLPAGPSRSGWDGRDARGRSVGSGVYYYRLVTGDATKTRRMVLLK